MEPAEKVTITLAPEMVRELKSIVASGEYGSTSEAIRDAVRVWHMRRAEDAERLNAIRARIRRSIDDPRPDMTSAEVDAFLDTLFARAEQSGGNAAA